MTTVLLHGFCEDHTIWNAILSHSEQKENLVCLDLPGFGDQASNFAEGLTIERMAAFVKKEVEKIKDTEIIMIGHSLGGYVTLAFAAMYPKLLSGIGLFHSTALPDSEERKNTRLKTIDFVEANGAEAFHRVLIPNLFKSNTDQAIIEETIHMAKSAASEGIIAALHAMRDRPNSISVLENFEMPVLFIAGESDVLIPKSTILEQAAICKTAQVEILFNSAHMGLLEESRRSAFIIDAFMNFVKTMRHEA